MKETAYMLYNSKSRLRLIMKHIPKEQSVRSAVLVCTVLNMNGVSVDEYSIDWLSKAGKSAKKAKVGDVIVQDDLAYLVVDDNLSLTISPTLQATLTPIPPKASLRRIV